MGRQGGVRKGDRRRNSLSNRGVKPREILAQRPREGRISRRNEWSTGADDSKISIGFSSMIVIGGLCKSSCWFDSTQHPCKVCFQVKIIKCMRSVCPSYPRKCFPLQILDFLTIALIPTLQVWLDVTRSQSIGMWLEWAPLLKCTQFSSKVTHFLWGTIARPPWRYHQ